MGPRVLLLDDDEQFVADAQAALSGAGCEVTSLPSGDAGLARAVTDRFDVVVVSAELRGVNGFRLCNRMKKDQRVQAVPVLLLAGAASAAGVEGHRQLPTRADVYLMKPLEMSELLAQVRARAPAPASVSDQAPTEPRRRVD